VQLEPLVLLEEQELLVTRVLLAQLVQPVIQDPRDRPVLLAQLEQPE
jgi:hypothetical protein